MLEEFRLLHVDTVSRTQLDPNPDPTTAAQFGSLPSPQPIVTSTSSLASSQPLDLPVQGLGYLSSNVVDSSTGNLSVSSVPPLTCSPSRSVLIKDKGLASTSDNSMGINQFGSVGVNSTDGGMGWHHIAHQHSISSLGLGFTYYMPGHIPQIAPHVVSQVSTTFSAPNLSALHSHDPYNQPSAHYSFY